MPYSFVDVEASRTRRVLLLFATLAAIYTGGFLLLYLAVALELDSRDGLRGLKSLLAARYVLGVLAAALLAAAVHWTVSVRGMVPRALDLIGAGPLDPEDRLHRLFGNVVAEVSAATGGRAFQAVATSSRRMTAFALADFTGRQVIGVSEALLVRLTRAELEAVVAHEAAHLVQGDSLLTTVSCSMAGVWAGMARALLPDDGVDGDAGLQVRFGGRAFLVLAVVYLLRGLTFLLNAWLSREREYRADATAVRLSRDPLALARALHAIAGDTRPGLLPADELAALFIVDPRRRPERLQIVSFLSRHPPVERRLRILLGMAHTDRRALDGSPAAAPAADRADVELQTPPQARPWFALEGTTWRGPYSTIEVAALPWLTAATLVSRGDARLAVAAWEHPEINRQLKGLDAPTQRDGPCPACGGELRGVTYESVPLKKCASCAGRLITRERFSRVLARELRPPEAHVQALARELIAGRLRGGSRGETHPDTLAQEERRCPSCAMTMIGRDYQALLPHRVRIDRCEPCGLIWFDAGELELIEHILG